jgi:hypothetical protein
MDKLLRLMMMVLAVVPFGCDRDLREYEIGLLKFKLPPTYIEVTRKKDQIASQIPKQAPTTEHFIRFERKSGEKLYLFYWQGFPWRDYGPMSVKASYPITIAEQQSKILRTDVFMGEKKEVLVVHFQLPNDDRAMIFSPDLELEAFKKFLEILEFP